MSKPTSLVNLRPSLGILLALGVAVLGVGPVRAEQDLDRGPGMFEDLPQVPVTALRGASVLPAFGRADRPMELPGALDRVRAAVESGASPAQADLELLAEYARRSVEAVRHSAETVDGDRSLDALLDDVLADRATPSQRPLEPSEVAQLAGLLQTLSLDLDQYARALWLSELGTRPVPRLGGTSVGGLGASEVRSLNQDYLPAIRGRILASTRTLQDVLQKS